METHSGKFFHACTFQLNRPDNCQRHFVIELGLTEATAFTEYNLGPPVLRRNIGISGLINVTQMFVHFYYGLRTALATHQQLITANSCTTTL